MRHARSRIALILCLTLLLSGCSAGGSGGAPEETPAPPAETVAPEETPAPAPEEKDLLHEGVAVTIGERNYSPAEITYLYTTQFNQLAGSYYGSLFGLDASKGAHGLGAAPFNGPAVEGKTFETWRDYFLDAVYTYLGQTQHLLDYARENGIELTEEELAAAEENIASLESYAAQYGYADTEEFLSAAFGDGVDTQTLLTMEKENMLAGKAYLAFQDSMSFSGEELAAEYDSFNGEYDTFTFAVYTVKAQTENGEEPTQEAVAEAEAEADAIIAAYRDGDDVEDLYERFSGYVEEELGQEVSLNRNVRGSYIPGALGDWLKDSTRQPGDVTRITEGGSVNVELFIGREGADYPLVNIRHILIMAEQSADGTWSEEALAAASAEAERILAEWEAGDRTEESFAELARQYSQDPGSAANGGLYENVFKGQMVQEFNDFCFAEHQPGDTGIVYGSNGGYAGYHVMYYSGTGETYGAKLAADSLREKTLAAWMEELPLITPGPEETLVDAAPES